MCGKKCTPDKILATPTSIVCCVTCCTGESDQDAGDSGGGVRLRLQCVVLPVCCVTCMLCYLLDR